MILNINFFFRLFKFIKTYKDTLIILFVLVILFLVWYVLHELNTYILLIVEQVQKELLAVQQIQAKLLSQIELLNISIANKSIESPTNWYAIKPSSEYLINGLLGLGVIVVGLIIIIYIGGGQPPSDKAGNILTTIDNTVNCEGLPLPVNSEIFSTSDINILPMIGELGVPSKISVITYAENSLPEVISILLATDSTTFQILHMFSRLLDQILPSSGLQ